jgi:hypothetical protein
MADSSAEVPTDTQSPVHLAGLLDQHVAKRVTQICYNYGEKKAKWKLRRKVTGYE